MVPSMPATESDDMNSGAAGEIDAEVGQRRSQHRRSEQRAVGKTAQVDVVATVVGDAPAHGDDEAVVLAVGVDAQPRLFAAHGGGLVLDAEQVDLWLDA